MEPHDYEKFSTWQDDSHFREWNMWGYIDARDCAQAVRKALHVDFVGADNFVIANEDTVMEKTSAELMQEVFPEIPVKRELQGHETLLSIDKAPVLGRRFRDAIAKARSEEPVTDSVDAGNSEGRGAPEVPHVSEPITAAQSDNEADPDYDPSPLEFIIPLVVLIGTIVSSASNSLTFETSLPRLVNDTGTSKYDGVTKEKKITIEILQGTGPVDSTARVMAQQEGGDAKENKD